jgi:hypothetical protein
MAPQADALLAAVSPAAIAGRSGRELRAALRKLQTPPHGAIVVGAG